MDKIKCLKKFSCLVVILELFIIPTLSGNNFGSDTGEIITENNAETIKLQEYPHYTTKLQFSPIYSNLPNCNGQNCNINLIPPKNHRILLIINPSLPITNYTYIQAAKKFSIEELKILVAKKGEKYCVPYLNIDNSEIQFCSELLIGNGRYFVRSYFVGPQILGTDKPNEGINIKWAQPNLGAEASTDRSITVYVTSYLDCSRIDLIPPIGYKRCSATKCIPTSLFCNEEPNCAEVNLLTPEDQYNFAGILTSLDETDCIYNTNHKLINPEQYEHTFRPLFLPKPTTTAMSVPLNNNNDEDNSKSTTAPTTKRPWWHWFRPEDKSTTSTTTTTTTTTTELPYYQITSGNDDNYRPWYSPGSPIATVFIFITVVIGIFAVCSFLAKFHGKRRPIYQDESPTSSSLSNRNSFNAGRAYSIESHNNVFARQLIEMIEDQHRQQEQYNNINGIISVDNPNYHGGLSSFTSAGHNDNTGGSNNIGPPPTYKEDPTLPSYDSLFGGDKDNQGNVK